MSNQPVCVTSSNPADKRSYREEHSVHEKDTKAINSDDNSSDTDNIDECDSHLFPLMCKGLVGMQNMGNTCYMNAALQALSNTEALTYYLMSCEQYVEFICYKKQFEISLSYLKLIKNIWGNPWYNQNNCIMPINILNGIRRINSLFRGYQQHDTQEFLRCFMDILHEELKEPVFDFSIQQEIDDDNLSSGGSHSEAEYETCDSGVSERSSLSDDALNISPNLVTAANSDNDCAANDTVAAGGDYHKNIKHEEISHLATNQKFRSIISDLFDGKLLSSVECLTCNQTSSSNETFQDLSLPIPSREQLTVLHSTNMFGTNDNMDRLVTYYDDWFSWIFEWIKSWFYGPSITLYDCLSAFFSADELKGDNMYSCGKCKKLRNGVKYSKLMELPEILCIHLKRFRHEMNFSSKICNQVTFPLYNLDLRPYVHENCISSNTVYNLYAVICHHGGACGGHYICYAFNSYLQNWYAFDDHSVQEVSPEIIKNAEAYVLFYKKINKNSNVRDNFLKKLPSTEEDVEDCYYISKQWIVQFLTCSEPTSINNFDFLCCHQKVNPLRKALFQDITIKIPASMWFFLESRYGGGPRCQQFDICSICRKLLENANEPEACGDNFQRDLIDKEIVNLEENLNLVTNNQTEPDVSTNETVDYNDELINLFNVDSCFW